MCFLPPGTSLVTSNAINAMVDERIGTVEGVLNVSRRTGRAEMDEHAEGVNTSEILVCLDPTASRSREQSIQDIREQVENVPGVIASVEQPLSHLISHMLFRSKSTGGH